VVEQLDWVVRPNLAHTSVLWERAESRDQGLAVSISVDAGSDHRDRLHRHRVGADDCECERPGGIDATVPERGDLLVGFSGHPGDLGLRQRVDATES